MNNWLEILIIILFFAFSALSSISNAKKKKSGDSTLSDGWDDIDTPAGSPPPLTPVEQPRHQTFDDSSIWGAPATTTKQNQSDYYNDHRYENDMQDSKEIQSRTSPRRSIDPLDDPMVEHRHSQEKTLQDVFREIFQVDIQVKDEPEDLHEPAPQPVVEKKPIHKKPAQKKPAQTSLERLVKESKERNRKPKISTAPPATISNRYDQHPLTRLALEAQHHPARLAVIYSEILKRPQPLRPFPKMPNQP